MRFVGGRRPRLPRSLKEIDSSSEAANEDICRARNVLGVRKDKELERDLQPVGQ